MLGKMTTSYVNMMKNLSSEKVQKKPLGERLELAGKGLKETFVDPFKNKEEVFISNGATNIAPPPLQEETFIETPQQITNQPPIEKQIELPFADKTTGEKFELKQTEKGPAIAMLPDEKPEVAENKTRGEAKIENGKGNRVIDGEIYVNGKIMDPETGEVGDKQFWTYKDKTVTGKKLEHIDDEVYVDGKQWDPESGKFTGKKYVLAGDKKLFGKDIAAAGGDWVIDGNAYNPSTGELIGKDVPPEIPKETKKPVMEGIEFAADGANMAVAGIGGAVAGVLGMADAALALGLVVAGGPVTIPALLLMTAGAGGGFLVGSKIGEKLSKGAGKVGSWISKKLGKSEDAGRVAGKAALSLGMTPIAAGVEGLAIAGGVLALGGGAGKIADKIQERKEEKRKKKF